MLKRLAVQSTRNIPRARQMTTEAKPTTGGSSIVQRFTAFCVGVAGSSGFYYFQIK